MLQPLRGSRPTSVKKLRKMEMADSATEDLVEQRLNLPQPPRSGRNDSLYIFMMLSMNLAIATNVCPIPTGTTKLRAT